MENRLNQFYKNGHGYHTLTFPNGFVLKGRWNMEKYLSFYELPDNMSGKTVLDIGCANGYFSFEFERRGAKVTAIDRDHFFWNEEIKSLMDSKVDFIIQDINTINESFGKFDIVFCGALLMHLEDFVGAIKKIKEITKERAILATAVMQQDQPIPLARFVGEKKVGLGGRPFFTYWQPNMTCFKKIAETVGFKAEKKSTFTIESENKKQKSHFGIIHCFV